MIVVVRIFDKDVDLGEADRDGDADASRAGGDRQLTVLFGDGRRLENADGADVGGKRASDISPGWMFRGLRGFVLRQRGSTRRSSICSLRFSSHRGLSSITKSARARAYRPGQRRREAPGSGPLERQRRAGPALCGGRASRAFSVSVFSSAYFASSREQVGLRRGLLRGRRRLAVGAVFRLHASEDVELAHAEHLGHVGGPQAPLDGAFDVAECVGRIAVATPTKGLVEENDLVGVTLEEAGIVPVLVGMRDMPECIAEPLVESFAEALSWKFVSDGLHQRICEFCLVLGGAPLRRSEVIGFERGRRERANNC
jgi:hypothetical protein